MKKEKETLFIVIKLGHVNGIDFYEEHMKVLEKTGFVDFARVSKKNIAITDFDRNKVFVKESKSAQNRLIQMAVEDIERGEVYPEYYNSIDLTGAKWMRIKKMQIINGDELTQKYCRSNGEPIKALGRGSIPFFFIKEKKE